ncbi:CBS domain-containing protein, partial [Stenotrophomonas sp. SrG]|uniref:CBS domain-containing protein n=1 Tax=Stenotrophomonas sp. SrG TaxID=3414430 RepID=UPI003CEBDA62
MTTVRQLLEGKAPEVFAVGPESAVIDAIRLMADKGSGAVLVMDGRSLVGILSERDYARK